MQSLKKAARILRSFERDKPEWGVRELAARLGWSRSSTHLYLQTLAELHFLRRTPNGRYRLSWRNIEFAEHLHRGLSWYGHTRTWMQQIASRTRTLGVICVLEGPNVVCIDRFSADPDLPYDHIQTDVYLPANATAAGKVLYAFGALPAPPLTAFSANTITTADEWRTELERVRTQGMAFSIEEWLPGQCALAVPVFVDGRLEATLGLQLPLERFNREQHTLKQALLEAPRGGPLTHFNVP